MSLPPGPRLPRMLQTALVWRLPRPFLDRCHRRFGDAFTIDTVGMGPLVYLADPADIRAVFAGDPAVFHAGEANSVARGIVGESSVLLLDEDHHRDRRRLLSPPFHRDAVRAQAGLMARVAAAEIDRWPVGRPFPVAPRMSAIALEIILRIVIGADDERAVAALRRALPAFAEPGLLTTLSLVDPELMRRRPWAGLRRRRALADRLLYTEIARTRTDPDLARRTDVLAMLVRGTGPSVSDDEMADEEMADDELRDQLVTLLMAGHETTATMLSWALERLVRHPDVLRRAVAAADDDGGDAYLDAVIRETLRVRPVLSQVARTLTRETELAGHRLPAGTIVLPAIRLVQLAERHHPDATRFDPQRWVGAAPSPATWFPYGGGGRRCLGATFAHVEMRVVLREVLRRVELASTARPGERRRAKTLTLVPHRGGRIVVRARRPVPPVAGL